MSRNPVRQDRVLPPVVTSREGRVSRNGTDRIDKPLPKVTSREGRVSRNCVVFVIDKATLVTSREGRVSRNRIHRGWSEKYRRHVPRGTCE